MHTHVKRIGFLKLRPDSSIYTFELDRERVSKNTSSSLYNYNIGLGYDETIHSMWFNNKMQYNLTFKTLTEIMNMLGHKYIDVLKMDIEHAEYEFIDKEAHLLKKVGQFLVEFHKFDGKERNIIDYIEKIEKQGMRLFHKENNLSDGCCTELAFIQKDWEDWEKQKY